MSHFICLASCLFVCLSVWLPACLSAYLSGCLPVCLLVSVYLPVCLSVCLSIYLSIHPFKQNELTFWGGPQYWSIPPVSIPCIKVPNINSDGLLNSEHLEDEQAPTDLNSEAVGRVKLGKEELAASVPDIGQLEKVGGRKQRLKEEPRVIKNDKFRKVTFCCIKAHHLTGSPAFRIMTLHIAI